MSYEASITQLSTPALIAVHSSPDSKDTVESAIELLLPSESHVATGKGDLVAFRIGPFEWLIRARLDDEDALAGRLDSAVDGHFASVVVVTDAHATFRVSGRDSREVLCQVVALDLDPRVFEPGTARRCVFGKTSALVHHVDSDPTYDVYVESTLAEYTRRLLRIATGRGIEPP